MCVCCPAADHGLCPGPDTAVPRYSELEGCVLVSVLVIVRVIVDVRVCVTVIVMLLLLLLLFLYVLVLCVLVVLFVLCYARAFKHGHHTVGYTTSINHRPPLSKDGGFQIRPPMLSRGLLVREGWLANASPGVIQGIACPKMMAPNPYPRVTQEIGVCSSWLFGKI